MNKNNRGFQERVDEHKERVRRFVTHLIERGATSTQSNRLPEDGWDGSYKEGYVLEPPFNPVLLSEEWQYSPTLGPAIAAMATNVHAMGHTWDPRYDLDKKAKDYEAQQEAMDAEMENLVDWVMFASPEIGWENTKYRFGVDYEGIGWGCLEALRSPTEKGPGSNNLLLGLEHFPAHQIRLVRQDSEATEADWWHWNRRSRKWETRKVLKRFRRFVQLVNGKKRYFREFGDPRGLDPETGYYLTEDEVKERAEKDLANEILYVPQYAPGTAYGLPRYIGSLISIEGGRKAEEANYDVLDDNGIPPMLVFLLGAALTKAGLGDYKQYFSGRKKFHRPLLLEAEMDEGGPMQGGGAASTKIEVVKLNELQIKDAMFQKYDERCQEKVRRAFRIGDLYYGMEKSPNFAVANVSMQLANAQVFGPEMRRFDHLMNTRILPEIGANSWTFRSKGPAIEDVATKVRAYEAGVRGGAIPDQDTSAEILESLIGIPIPRTDEEWGKLPFEMAKAGWTPADFQEEPDVGDEIPTEGVPEDGDQTSRHKKRRKDSPLVRDLSYVVVRALLKARKDIQSQVDHDV